MQEAISKTNIKSFQKTFKKNPAHKISRNALTRSSMLDVAMNWDAFSKVDHIYSHKIKNEMKKVTNQKSSGFLPEERQVMTDWLADGWVDVFRKQHPGEAGHYSWWRQWGNARADNVGWRIDYILGSPSAAKRVTQSYILREITGSDHCPVGVDWE